jgi:exodeoxyribonuclease VII large subunit
MPTHIFTVTQLTARIKDLLEGSFPDVWVEGEISNLSIPQSGHAYFTLKDEQSQVRAVVFRSSRQRLKFSLQHGMHVICRGRVGVYEPRGEYQLILEYIEPKGIGALQKAYEELKAKLEKEGLFAPERKKPLPLLPRRIGIVTSPTGAAIQDILRVIKRRHPNVHILIYSVPVQGPEAAPAIVEAIRYFNRERNVDVMIVGRGGGSLEDLWAFNEEQVARAIFASAIPVISAVGHETDYTIADFVADLRAPTPSAAAEMVVESEVHFRDQIAVLESLLARSIRQQFERLRAPLREAMRVLVDPRRKLEQFVQRVDELLDRLATGIGHHLRRDRQLLASYASALDHLNPLGILSRGYSITKKLPEGTILKDASEVKPGDRLSTLLHRGEVVSRVETTGKDERRS